MYETQTQFAQQSTNDQQAKNVARKTRFDGQASQGQYPFAQQGSQQAQQSGAAAQGAAITNAQKPPAPQPTFAQLQAQGMARPAPPAPAPQPQQMQQQMGQVQQAMTGMLGGQPQGTDAQRMVAQQQQAGAQQVQPTGNAVPFSGQGQQPGQQSPAFGAAQGQTGMTSNVQTALAQMLANPSAYNTDAVMGTYNRLAGQIDDQYNQQDTRINEEMARRGIYDSSIAGGRLADSNIARRSASVELADRLAQQQAEKFDQARQAALGLGLTDQAQQNQQSQFYSNLAQDNSQFNSDLGYRRDSLAQNDRQFGAEFGQRQYEYDGDQGYRYDALAQNGNLDFLRLLGADVVDYGEPTGTAQWQGDEPVTR